MDIFQHRVNSIEKLKNVPSTYGVEIDIRTFGSKLILEHDAFEEGTSFEDWLGNFTHNGIILNIKEEGLENSIIELMGEFGITNYFFLDQSFPFLVKLVRAGNTKCAIRVSDIESVQTAQSLQTDWIWLDSFSGNWDYLLGQEFRLLSNRSKLCIVSPELQRANSLKEAMELRDIIDNLDFKIDAVCTKNPELWL